MEKTAHLGIDVSKGYADFLLLDSQKQVLEEGFVLDDSREGRGRLTALIEGWFAGGITHLYCGVESTGGYENNWFTHLCSLGAGYEGSGQTLRVARLNPKAVKSCGEAAMIRTQTDATSAGSIASYLIDWPARILYSPRIGVPENPVWAEARQHVRFVNMLIKQKVQLTNQLEKLIYQQGSELLVYCRNGIPGWMLRLLVRYPSRWHLRRAGQDKIAAIKGISSARAGSLLGKLDPAPSRSSATICHTLQATARQILHLQAQIDNQQQFLTNQFKDHRDVQLLDSIKGMGVATAVRMVLEIEDIARFKSAKKLCAYFGVHPTWKQSGDGIWYLGMSKKGRPAVRAALYMCSLSAIRCNPDLKKLYHHFRSKGMNHYQAAGVIMHKLLRIVYGILSTQTPYNPAVDRANRKKAEKNRKAHKARMAAKKQTNQLRRDRYNKSNLPEQVEQAPLSRRAYKKRKQAVSQSSLVEECAGSPPADVPKEHVE